MSKRALKQYLNTLEAEALREQILDLYDRFSEVNTYYKFVFNPNEERLINEAKAKIHEEYFPRRRKRAKARRSVAKKLIRHFRTLEVDPSLLADLMGYNLEIAFEYSRENRCYEAFYKSMAESYREWVGYVTYHMLYEAFRDRLDAFAEKVASDAWPNAERFAEILEQSDPI